MTRIPTNCTFSVKRNREIVEGLEALPCLLLPARPEIVAMNGPAAGKAFEFTFSTIVTDLREQDQLVTDD